MKTERRHELQTNDLADWLGKKLETIEPYGRVIVGVIVGLMVLAGVYMYWSNQQEAQEQQVWNEFLASLNDADALRDVVERHPDADATQWARLTLAELQLGDGVELMFTDRAAATEQLNRAVENFKLLREDASDESIRARAALGWGKALESLNQLDEAREQFQWLVDAMPESAYAMEAKNRLADLDRQGTKTFYDWFATLQPESELSDEPGTPGEHPTLDFGELPTDGSLLESPLNLDNATELPVLGNPTSETPAEAPATEAPESQSPAGEAPSE